MILQDVLLMTYLIQLSSIWPRLLYILLLIIFLFRNNRYLYLVLLKHIKMHSKKYLEKRKMCFDWSLFKEWCDKNKLKNKKYAICGLILSHKQRKL